MLCAGVPLGKAAPWFLPTALGSLAGTAAAAELLQWSEILRHSVSLVPAQCPREVLCFTFRLADAISSSRMLLLQPWHCLPEKYPFLFPFTVMRKHLSLLFQASQTAFYQHKHLRCFYNFHLITPAWLASPPFIISFCFCASALPSATLFCHAAPSS